ncbi:MAG: stage IV sporulation protein A, partial [Clostridia bacterium]|nr:stage IV sporulation protein A [Clostridia bacterium]
VGTEEQSEEVLKKMMESLKDSPEKIWQSTMFGKSLYDLVGEGLRAELAHVPEESRVKLSETLERIINEGSGGLICILL